MRLGSIVVAFRCWRAICLHQHRERIGTMTARHLVALAAIALSACVSVPNQPYNKAANVHVKKIGVVTVPNPAEYQVGMLHHPGEGFGLIGGLIAAGDASSKTKIFSGQEVVHRVELGKEMTAALTEAFDGSPFQVVLVDAGAAPRTEFVKDYPGAECDAFLDVAIAQVGYRAQYASTPYLPLLFAPVRLVDARSKTVLYTTEVFMTDGPIPKGGIQLVPDTTYAFNDFDALKRDPDKAVMGLKDATRRIAKQIASDLK